MDRIRRLLTGRAQLPVPVNDESSNEDGEWIPRQQDVVETYSELLRISREARVNTPVRTVIPVSRKIGQRTFIEGCFCSILLLACWVGNVPVVSYLLTRYTQYFSIDTLIDSLSPQYDCLPVLCDSKEKTRFNQLKSDKISLLHAAAEGMRVRVIKLLLSAGANVNNQSRWSITPLISALLLRSNYRRSASLAYLEDSGANEVHPYACCKMTLACLIDSGANVNYADAGGLTPLMYAANFEGGVDLVEMLIEAGANLYAIDNDGYTALHHSCLGKQTEVVKYLLIIAPDLLLHGGKPSLACPAPYLTVFDPDIYTLGTSVHLTNVDLMEVFLDNPNCPSTMKLDIKLLRVVYTLLRSPPSSLYPECLDAVKKFVKSAMDPMIEPSGEVPLSSFKNVIKEKAQLAVLESIKSMDPASNMCHPKLVQQCLLFSVSYFMFSSVERMEIFSCCLRHLQCSPLCEHNTLHVAEQLSEMLFFQLHSMQNRCLTQRSLSSIMAVSTRLIDLACKAKVHALLKIAINVFIALANSLGRVNVSFVWEMHNTLHSSSYCIFDTLASLDSKKETTRLMARFAMCNPPLLVNVSNGYPESLLHIALSNSRMLRSSLLQTFLKSGGDRWINTPGVNGCRPLHLSLLKKVEVLLINCGAHLDAVAVDGSIPRCSKEYFKRHPRPLSCIVARSIAMAGGLMEHEIGLLPARVKAFVSLHDSCATRTEIDSILGSYSN